MSSASLLAFPVSQPIPNEIATLAAENTKLKESVLRVRDETPSSLSVRDIDACQPTST